MALRGMGHRPSRCPGAPSAPRSSAGPGTDPGKGDLTRGYGTPSMAAMAPDHAAPSTGAPSCSEAAARWRWPRCSPPAATTTRAPRPRRCPPPRRRPPPPFPRRARRHDRAAPPRPAPGPRAGGRDHRRGAAELRGGGLRSRLRGGIAAGARLVGLRAAGLLGAVRRGAVRRRPPVAVLVPGDRPAGAGEGRGRLRGRPRAPAERLRPGLARRRADPALGPERAPRLGQRAAPARRGVGDRRAAVPDSLGLGHVVAGLRARPRRAEGAQLEPARWTSATRAASRSTTTVSRP